MRVADLTGATLDYWVAKAEGAKVKILKPGDIINDFLIREHHGICCFKLTDGYDDWYQPFVPSTAWSVGGPIIERERIDINTDVYGWTAYIDISNRQLGDTALEAAMRSFVFSEFGETVPDETGDQP